MTPEEPVNLNLNTNKNDPKGMGNWMEDWMKDWIRNALQLIWMTICFLGIVICVVGALVLVWQSVKREHEIDSLLKEHRQEHNIPNTP